MIALYSAADWRSVARQLTMLDGMWLAAALLLFVPQTLVSAVRWRALVAPLCGISLVESLRQTFSASAFNLIVPSKLGDLSKAAMLPIDGSHHRATAGSLAVIEKLGDVLCLALLAACCAWGSSSLSAAPILLAPIAFAGLPAACRRVPGPSWFASAQTNIPASGSWLASFALLTALLWVLHLVQIHAFLLAAGVSVPWQVSFARVPLAIFAGLLPVSLCGVGTRDSTLVWLFADVAPASTMAVVGLLTALRYLVPGAVGIPLVMSSCRRSTAGSR